MELNLLLPLGLAVGTALVIALYLVWMKPEYGLFCYGLALGFPDIAVPLGTAINIRLDDGLLLLFLLRMFLWTPAPVTSGPKKLLGCETLFFAACILSAVVGIALWTPPAAYETFKMIGCAAILAVLPRLLQLERRLRFLVSGLMCGGIALIIQVIQHIRSSSLNEFANFQQLKNAATFTTWNPNTIGQASMLLVFVAGLGWITFSRSRVNNILWFGLSTLFALTPVSVFARGTSLSIAAGYILFLCLTRRWKLVLTFACVCLFVLVYLYSTNRLIVQGAVKVDVTTGEGFSHRFDRWDMAIKEIGAAPVVGNGFGQEWFLLDSAGSDGRAHNAYLTVWIELGLGGVALLLAIVYQFVSAGLSLYRRPESQLYGALLLALIFAICVDSMGLPTLYWEKLPTIALSIGIALVGICERRYLQSVPELTHIPKLAVLAEQSLILILIGCDLPSFLDRMPYEECGHVRARSPSGIGNCCMPE